MRRSARITIHPEALQNNLKQAKIAAPHSKVNAVIKANAYGHGAVETAGILYQISDGFAVSCVPEALELRQAGIDLPITVLQGHQSVDDLRIAAAYQLRLVVHDDRQLSLLNQINLKSQQHFDLGIKIDTGMHRLGFAPERAETIYTQLKNHAQVNPDELIMMTHFSCADERKNNASQKQLETFANVCENIKAPKSIANSAGILEWQASHADWIRPGIMLYGSSPFADSHRDEHHLQAAMTLNAPVIAIHDLKKGDSIGYGASYQCPKKMRVATIACGYADGYPRHAATGTPVYINGQETTLLGRVSMDMIVIDVTDFKENPVAVGDTAELWGANLSVDKVAQSAETIAYELLCNAGNLCTRSGI